MIDRSDVIQPTPTPPINKETAWWRCPGIAFNWGDYEPTGPSYLDLRDCVDPKRWD